jgi:tRNA (guanine37-N1)-methyltransferase
MLYLKVPRKDAETTRRKLVAAGIFSGSYEIIREGGFIYLPATEKFGAFEAVSIDAAKRDISPPNLRAEMSKILSESELESFVSSFDMIGDIAVVEIPLPLEPKERQIGDALLRLHKNIRTVLKKLGAMEGEFRVRKFACISGENKTETIYKENGLKMRLDLAKVYFSPRLGTERRRIADSVRDGEKVLVLFAGVGPFALAIAKQKPKTEITALEINPDAVRYMRENIKLNKIKNIAAIEGDAKEIPLPDSGFDRIVMPLPKSAHEFLPVAFRAAKDGAVVHFYAIAGSRDAFNEALALAKPAAEKSGVRLKILSQRIVRPYSPSSVQVVLDIRISKGPKGSLTKG